MLLQWYVTHIQIFNIQLLTDLPVTTCILPARTVFRLFILVCHINTHYLAFFPSYGFFFTYINSFSIVTSVQHSIGKAISIWAWASIVKDMIIIIAEFFMISSILLSPHPYLTSSLQSSQCLGNWLHSRRLTVLVVKSSLLSHVSIIKDGRIFFSVLV